MHFHEAFCSFTFILQAKCISTFSFIEHNNNNGKNREREKEHQTQFHFNQWNSIQTIWRFVHTLYADVYIVENRCKYAYVFACMRADFIVLYHFCLLKRQAPTKQRMLSAHNEPKQQRLMITVCSYKSTLFGCERL